MLYGHVQRQYPEALGRLEVKEHEVAISGDDKFWWVSGGADEEGGSSVGGDDDDDDDDDGE